MLELSYYCELELYVDSLLERAVVGCFVSKIFNSPFDMRGSKGIVYRKSDYGYLFMGALALKFCLWMMEKAVSKGIDEILFSSRDGHIVKMVYEYLSDNCFGKERLPDAVYLYASRAAYVNMSLFCEEDIKFAYELAYDGSPEEMLKDRFKLSEQEIDGYDAEKDSDDWEYIRKHSDRILSKAAFYRIGFCQYVRKNHIRFSRKSAYFDFVSSGTCQWCLQKVIGQSLKGYYFSYIDSKYTHSVLDIDELFHNQFGCINDSFLCNHYLFLENIFTSGEATVKEFDYKGDVIFMPENRTETQLKEIMEIHEGIMEFVRDLTVLLNKRLEGTFKKEIPDKMFEYVLGENTEYLTDMKVNGSLIDEFCHRTLDASAILGEINF